MFSNTTVQKHQFFGASFLYSPTLISIHDYWKNDQPRQHIEKQGHYFANKVPSKLPAALQVCAILDLEYET